MHHRMIPLALSAALALLGGGHALAVDQAKPAQPAASQAKAGPLKTPKLVDINSASRAELKTLPGIGDAEADRIIAARPYPSKVKLTADKVLPDATYLALKGRIIAVQKDPPKRKTAGKNDNKTSDKTGGKP